MMLKVFRWCACALGVSFAGTASAATGGFLYDCDMPDFEAGFGWVSPKIAIVVPADGAVTVVDALTIAFSDAPVTAKVLRDNAARLIVRWTLKNARADKGQSFANFDYRASISKASGEIVLTAGPRNFDTGLSSVGRCTKRTE